MAYNSFPYFCSRKSFNVSNVGLTSDTSVKMDEEPLASPICDKLSNSLIQLETSRYHEVRQFSFSTQ